MGNFDEALRTMILDRDDEFRQTIAFYFEKHFPKAAFPTYPTAAQMDAYLSWCRNGATGEQIDAQLAKEPEAIAYANRPKVTALPRIVARGRDLVTEAGDRHVIVGSTELMLAWRFDRDGADQIRPTLEQRQTCGFNNLRVLWQKNLNQAGFPWQMPLEKMPLFLALCAHYGFYVQGTILADCAVVNPDERDQHRRVDTVREATAGITNHFEQLGNEYQKNDHDPTHFTKPTDRLAANSSAVERGADAPYWDYFCFSGQRKPLNHAIREYGPIEFMYGDGAWGGVPAICDEGMKPGEDSSDPRDWERAGAQARSGCGGRIHTDAGTKGNSRIFNDLELQCAVSFVRGLVG